MSLIDEAIAELHAVKQHLADEAHALATPVENVLEKLGTGLAQAGSVVDAVTPGVEAADPAVTPLVRDVHALVTAALAGDEAAQRAVEKIQAAADTGKQEIAQAQADAAGAAPATEEPAPADAPAPAPATPPTGDGTAAPSPAETGAVEPQAEPPVTAQQ